MKKLLSIIVVLISLSVSAQKYKIIGDEFVRVDTTGSEKTSTSSTGKFTTVKGTKYPVYKSLKGTYFIERVSKKTGKKYRQYLKLQN